MDRPLVLAAGSMLDCDANELLTAAAGAGFDGVGLRVSDQHRVADPAALRGRAADLGLMIHDAEVVRLAVGQPEPIALIEMVATIGAESLLVVSDIGDLTETADRIASLAEQCRAHGVRLGLEYMAWTTPDNPLDAIDVARHAGCELVVDLLHHVRVGAGITELDAVVTSGTLGWVQLSDASSSSPNARSLIVEARHHRRPPGEGELPLRELLERIPHGAVMSVEVQSDALLHVEPNARARLLHEAARSVIEQ